MTMSLLTYTKIGIILPGAIAQEICFSPLNPQSYLVMSKMGTMCTLILRPPLRIYRSHGPRLRPDVL